VIRSSISVAFVLSIGLPFSQPSFAQPRLATATLEQLLPDSSQRGDYQRVTTADREVIETLFRRALRTDTDVQELRSAWDRIGWELRVLGPANRPIWLIQETPGHARGYGYYAFRPSEPPSILLQAPHSYADRNTGKLVRQLFEGGASVAACWNSLHRRTVDAAHSEDHPFNVFLRAILAIHPQIQVVQIHGFSTAKRRTRTGRTSHLILSNGTALPDCRTRYAADRFAKDFPDHRTRLFPTSVRELGGTTNAQGVCMRRLGSTRFLHLELSEEFRQHLLAEQAARQLFLKSLADFSDYSDCTD
jgi:hypothetical protein